MTIFHCITCDGVCTLSAPPVRRPVAEVRAEIARLQVRLEGLREELEESEGEMSEDTMAWAEPVPEPPPPCRHVRRLAEQRCLYCGCELPWAWPTVASPELLKAGLAPAIDLSAEDSAIRRGRELVQSALGKGPACNDYSRPEGVMGGPCLNCGQSQSGHVERE